MKEMILLKNKGLTLIELLIAFVISSILMSGLYYTFIKQQKVYIIQEQVIDTQHAIRTAMDIMTRYIRMAGYDPKKTGNFGFQLIGSNGRSTGPNSIAFTIDENEDGEINDNNKEQIGFRLNGSTLEKYNPEENPPWNTLADNIEYLEFKYILSNGIETSSPNNPSDIRVVKVKIVGRTDIPDLEYKSDSGYRKRELCSSIKVRNLGL